MDDKTNAEFQESYRAYLRAMKKAWEAVDIDALDVTSMRSMAPTAGMQVAAGTWGTAGTVGTAGTGGGSIGTFGCAFTFGTWSDAIATSGNLSAPTCFARDPRAASYPGMPPNYAVAGTFGSFGTIGTVGTGTGTLGTAGSIGTAGSWG